MISITRDRETQALVAMDPPESFFGFTYHSHCIPPYRPGHMLILGYGNGTIFKLTRKIWGDDFRCAGVDTAHVHDSNKPWETIVYAEDARTFITETAIPVKASFDYIVVDLWNGGKVCEFVSDPEFVGNLKKIASGMISVNIPRAIAKQVNQVYLDAGFLYERGDIIEGNAVFFYSVK